MNHDNRTGLLNAEATFGSPKFTEHTDGKTILKIIFVSGKLLNIVAG